MDYLAHYATPFDGLPIAPVGSKVFLGVGLFTPKRPVQSKSRKGGVFNRVLTLIMAVNSLITVIHSGFGEFAPVATPFDYAKWHSLVDMLDVLDYGPKIALKYQHVVTEYWIPSVTDIQGVHLVSHSTGSGSQGGTMSSGPDTSPPFTKVEDEVTGVLDSVSVADRPPLPRPLSGTAFESDNYDSQRPWSSGTLFNIWATGFVPLTLIALFDAAKIDLYRARLLREKAVLGCSRVRYNHPRFPEQNFLRQSSSICRNQTSVEDIFRLHMRSKRATHENISETENMVDPFVYRPLGPPVLSENYVKVYLNDHQPLAGAPTVDNGSLSGLLPDGVMWVWTYPLISLAWILSVIIFGWLSADMYPLLDYGATRWVVAPFIADVSTPAKESSRIPPIDDDFEEESVPFFDAEDLLAAADNTEKMETLRDSGNSSSSSEPEDNLERSIALPDLPPIPTVDNDEKVEPDNHQRYQALQHSHIMLLDCGEIFGIPKENLVGFNNAQEFLSQLPSTDDEILDTPYELAMAIALGQNISELDDSIAISKEEAATGEVKESASSTTSFLLLMDRAKHINIIREALQNGNACACFAEAASVKESELDTWTYEALVERVKRIEAVLDARKNGKVCICFIEVANEENPSEYEAQEQAPDETVHEDGGPMDVSVFSSCSIRSTPSTPSFYLNPRAAPFVPCVSRLKAPTSESQSLAQPLPTPVKGCRRYRKRPNKRKPRVEAGTDSAPHRADA